MHGNVWEWCHDAWVESAYRKRVDDDNDPWQTLRARDYALEWKRLLKDEHRRVFRGGSWGGAARFCRSACRVGRHPDVRFGFLGFRVCLAPVRRFAGQPAGQKKSRTLPATPEPAG